MDRESAIHALSAALKGFRARVIYVITADVFIQSILSGAAFGIVNKSATVLAYWSSEDVKAWAGVYYPPPLYALPIVVIVFAVMFWIYHHKDQFDRDVEELTGEEPADEKDGGVD